MPPLPLRVSVCRSGVYQLEELARAGVHTGTPGLSPWFVLQEAARFLQKLAEEGLLHGHHDGKGAQHHAKALRALAACVNSFQGELGRIVFQELRPEELKP